MNMNYEHFKIYMQFYIFGYMKDYIGYATLVI